MPLPRAGTCAVLLRLCREFHDSHCRVLAGRSARSTPEDELPTFCRCSLLVAVYYGQVALKRRVASEGLENWDAPAKFPFEVDYKVFGLGLFHILLNPFQIPDIESDVFTINFTSRMRVTLAFVEAVVAIINLMLSNWDHLRAMRSQRIAPSLVSSMASRKSSLLAARRNSTSFSKRLLTRRTHLADGVAIFEI